MESDIVVKNTLAFQFPRNATQPTIADMGRFIKTLNGDRSMLDTAYKISDEKSVFIRFKCEDAMKFALENNEVTLSFRYTDGREVMVNMSVASGYTRYVRVFDLPPEVTDADLSKVLGNYGTVKRIVRERFPADIGLDIFSGVRGLYINIKKEIPEVLHFRGRKGRIFFEGVKSKCYVCKSEEHLKKACPIFKARRIEAQQQRQQQQQQQQHSETQSAVSPMGEGTDEAAALDAPMITTRQQKGETDSRNETKHNLSVDSDTNSQPPLKKKIIGQSECETESDLSMITSPDGNAMDNASESESDLAIDWKTATPEEQQAWFKKRERYDRKIDKKVARLLGKTAK